MTAGPNPSNAVRLFGTDEAAEPMRILKAGPLEASFDAGNLRYIRMGGKEALRAVAFIVRDRNWGTYNPAITNLTIREENDRFTVSYDAVCRDDRQAFRYSATITGEASGALSFAAEGEALTDFETNRTGFVVLHALEGVVGALVKVEHTDGRIEESRFPERIDPDCPFRDIRALTHDVSPGLSVTCRMEGDAFEMEDHRNWMDASYKTYIRPLAEPWPYTISKGEKTAQSVTLSFDGQLPAPAVAEGASETTVTIGGPLGHDMPRLGLAAPPEHNEAALAKAELLRAAAPSFLVCHFDARKGHGRNEMQGFAALGKAVGCELVLEAVVPCLDASGQPTDEPAVLKRDMAAIREAAEGVPFAHIAVSPACDLKCTLPGSIFPPAPSWEALFASARAAFPGVPLGGGMFSYFTELNRKRPPACVLDFICHSGSPIVHAGDDISVTETLEALPWIFNSVQAIAGGKPYWVFPTAISMRGNPYGAAPAENPDNIRQAMNRVDPRERGLLGAAWYAGYLAHAARAGVDAVTLAATAGPSGIVHARQDHAQPWFDEAQAAAMPVYSVVAGHMGLAGCRVRESRSSTPREVQALASSGPAGPVVWLSNLTGEARTVRLDGVDGAARMRVLDADNFEVACREPAMLPEEAASPDGVVLAPYAVAALRFPEA